MPQTAPQPRKGMPDPQLSQPEFKARFKSQFQDPAFRPLDAELERIAAVAWEGYVQGRKSPVTRKAGPGFADPDYDLSVDWIAARDAIQAAQARHDDKSGPMRFLLINASSRSEHTCPGEMSKSWRFTEMARDILGAPADTEVRVIDLSEMAAGYGRHYSSH